MTRMLTKDERRMLSAALGVLRANVIAEPGRRGGIAHRALLNAQLRLDVGATLSGAEWWAPVLVQTLVTVWSYTVRPVLGSRHERRHRERILRARLALAIRAVLRADAGWRGYWWVNVLDGGESRPSNSYGACVSVTKLCGGTVRRREALWTTAPSHEAVGEGR